MLWEHYAAVVAVVFLVNLMPAFAPPTALVLVLFKLNWHLNPVVLVVVGALTSGCGRFLLATATGRIRTHVSPHRQESLRAAGDYLTGHKGRSLLGLTLFLLSPIPSASLFEAAGLMGLRLLPITAAFVAGRLVSYSLYIGATSMAEKNLGAVFADAVTSVYGIALQIVLLLVVVLLARVDWTEVLPGTPRDRAGNRPGHTSVPGSAAGAERADEQLGPANRGRRWWAGPHRPGTKCSARRRRRL